MAKLKCNNCNQFKLMRRSDQIAGGGAIAMIIGLFLAVIVVGIPVIIIGVGMLIAGFAMRITGFMDVYTCRNCKRSYSIAEAKALHV